MKKNWPQRFWEKVAKTDGCWLWMASPSNEYGKVKIGGRWYLAHRVSYCLSNGFLLDGIVGIIRHKCDTPKCVRPDHLVAGNHQDNMNDMKDRGRHVAVNQKGPANGNAKLSQSDVSSIRSLIAAGLNNKQIASQFGVCHGTVSSIRRGKSRTQEDT